MSEEAQIMETDEAVRKSEENELEELEEDEEVREDPEDAVEEEEEEEAEEDENAGVEDQQGEESAPARKKRERKEPVPLKREPGKSVLPFSRVQKIIKADKDIPIIAKDAVLLVSLATEAFIMELVQAARVVAEKERRTTIQHKDIATVARKSDEFLFLEDIIPNVDPDKKRSKPVHTGNTTGGPTMLDHLFTKGNENGADVVMNEDGTMSNIPGPGVP